MSRTLQQWIDRASQDVAKAHLSFQILARQDDFNQPGTTLFVVAMPKALMRKGTLGGASPLTSGYYGIATEFGQHVHDTITDLGYEASLEVMTPHTVLIVLTREQRDAACAVDRQLASYRGLPKSVCDTLEALCQANDRPGQRFAEYLRRLI